MLAVVSGVIVQDRNGTGSKQLVELALRELRSRVFAGSLKPGRHLSEAAAAELIGMSRTPVREAMSRLVDEGLLDRTMTGRCTVRRVTGADVVDAIELRGVLEGAVLRRAAERGSDPHHLARCREIAAELDEVAGPAESDVDFERYVELNASFHRHLAGLAGSPTLEREALRAGRLPLASPNAFLQSQFDAPEVRRSLFVAQSQHHAMIDAVERREGARAEGLAREHARLARANLELMLDDQDLSAAIVPGLSKLTAAGTDGRGEAKGPPGRIQ